MWEQTIVNALLLGMTYVVVASGLTLVFGVMHVFNFAHGELYMLGGFLVAARATASMAMATTPAP